MKFKVGDRVHSYWNYEGTIVDIKSCSCRKVCSGVALVFDTGDGRTVDFCSDQFEHTLTSEEIYEGFSLGDKVYSKKWQFEGTIIGMEICNHDDCSKLSLRFKIGKGVVSVYHAEGFKKIS